MVRIVVSFQLQNRLPVSKLQNVPMHEVDSTEVVTITGLKSKSKIDNYIYTSLLKKRTSSAIGSQEKWFRELHVENVSDVDWNKAFTIALNGFYQIY